LSESETSNLVAAVCHERSAELTPPDWMANVYELTYPAAAECENCSRRVRLELSEQHDRRHTWELANYRRYPRSCV
jgi:hypothetical protein